MNNDTAINKFYALEQLNNILMNRQEQHGDFFEGAKIWYEMMEIAQTSSFYDYLPVHQKFALNMLFLKLSRILTSPYNLDDWLDSCGYLLNGLEVRK